MYRSSNYRTSIRSSGFKRHTYSKPLTVGTFNRSRNFSQRGVKTNHKSKLIGADVNIFIKKAQSETEDTILTHQTFEGFPIAAVLKQNIARKGYTTPTPIQDQAIESILTGRDLIGLADTGTGKTGAFLIPLIHKIYSSHNQRALIIAPTRELALQIQDEFKSFAFNMKVYSTLVIGGVNIYRQIRELQRGPHVVIATPGRLKDLIERQAIYLQDYKNIVLDEVDLMVDIGFIKDIKFFISLMPTPRQSLFFSATIPVKVREILNSFVKAPITVSLKQPESVNNIEQNIVKVESSVKKVDQLHDLLIQEGFEKVLIFGETKHSIDRLHKELEFRGFKAGAIHGNKSQGQRIRILDSFKNDQIQILLATDVASRGLDIENVTHVINYDLPKTYQDYIHRIGRTGRANKKGTALTFIN